MRNQDKTLTFSILIIALTGLAISLLPFSYASAVSLKRKSIIRDHTITVGDIFDGAGDKGERVLGMSPLPGKDMVLNARTLMRIALALDLGWRPNSSSDHVTLTRAATVIDTQSIKDQIKQSLDLQGIGDTYDLNIDSRLHPIVLPEEEAATLDIGNISYNPERKRFTATLYAPSKDNPIHQTQISGGIENVLTIPVLKTSTRQGTIIDSYDIEMVEIRESALKSNIIIDADTLLGMTPRKTILPGTPIRSAQIQQPQIVSKGALVTMIHRNGPLLLTAEGKALQGGAQGDTIRVVNTNSNKTVRAKIHGDNEVILETY